MTFDSLEYAREYAERNHLEWPLLVDTERKVYRQFGMGRATWWAIMKPSSIWKYFVLWIKGAKSQTVGSDVHQLGGDVVIDPDGVLRLNYLSKEPHDRPEIEDLLAMVRRAP